jgi:hypothetical protein
MLPSLDSRSGLSALIRKDLPAAEAIAEFLYGGKPWREGYLLN